MPVIAWLSREGLLNLPGKGNMWFQPSWPLVYSERHYPLYVVLIPSKLQKTCIVIFQDLSKYYSFFFFSFKCKPFNFHQSSLAEIQTLGKVLCICTHKEAECKLLKRILRVDMLIQKHIRCKLIRPHWEQRSCANCYVLTFGLLS